MNAQHHVEMDRAPAPATGTTVESCIQAIYDSVQATGTEIDYLEKAVASILRPEEQGTAEPASLSAVPPRKQQPEAIDKLQSLHVSIEMYRERLQSIRMRLAL